MNTSTFLIEYFYRNKLSLAEIKACYHKNLVWYYDVFSENQYQFTITPASYEKPEKKWKVLFKNADKYIASLLVEIIAKEIENHLLRKN